MDGQQGWSNSKKVRWVCKANKGVDLMTKKIASMNIFEIVEMMRMTLKMTEGGNNQEKMKTSWG